MLVFVFVCITSFAIILKRKRELVALLLLSFGCIVNVNVMWLFLIVVCLYHTHLPFNCIPIRLIFHEASPINAHVGLCKIFRCLSHLRAIKTHRSSAKTNYGCRWMLWPKFRPLTLMDTPTRALRTSDGGNGNHSVSLPIILIEIKVDQMLPSSYISSLLVPILWYCISFPISMNVRLYFGIGNIGNRKIFLKHHPPRVPTNSFARKCVPIFYIIYVKS